VSNAAANVGIVRKILSSPPPDGAGMAAFAAQWLDAAITLDYPGGSPIPFAGSWQGWKGVADFMSAYHHAIETQRMEVLSIDGAGDDVFVRGVTHGRVRRTGKLYVSPWLLIWTVKDSKIVRMLEYHDTQAIAGAFA
jgi:uncharacterized protein